MTQSFTILDDGTTHHVDASPAGDRLRLPASAVRDALGWELKPEGLCREATCIPVRDRDALVSEAGLDLAELARLLDRPLVLDLEERCAALGTGRAARASRMATLEAPDFELPDVQGRLHRLSDQRGRKVLLIAYASW